MIQDGSCDTGSQILLSRLFAFRQSPRLFALAGAIDAVCDLEPVRHVVRL